MMFGSFPVSVSHCELIVICKKRCYHWIGGSRYHPTRIVGIHSCYSSNQLLYQSVKKHERVSFEQVFSKNKKRFGFGNDLLHVLVCDLYVDLLLLNYMANTPRARLMCRSMFIYQLAHGALVSIFHYLLVYLYILRANIKIKNF
jgi:hypothetical protein